VQTFCFLYKNAVQSVKWWACVKPKLSLFQGRCHFRKAISTERYN
jgi:hypothetical protein